MTHVHLSCDPDKYMHVNHKIYTKHSYCNPGVNSIVQCVTAVTDVSRYFRSLCTVWFVLKAQVVHKLHRFVHRVQCCHVTSQIPLWRQSLVANMTFKLRGISHAVRWRQVLAQGQFRAEFLTALVTLERSLSLSMRCVVVSVERRRTKEVHVTDLALDNSLPVLETHRN